MKIKIIKKSPVQIRANENSPWEDYVYTGGVILQEINRIVDMGNAVSIVMEDGKEIRGLLRENFTFFA